MLEKLKDSIANFGYVDPLIWNQRTGHVVGGNQRLKVLKELGFKDVDVIVVDFPLEQEKALNIALNKISGDWEMDKLIELLEGLTDNLRLLAGFTEKEIEDLLNDLENNPYTMKVSKIQYEPLGISVDLDDLYDTEKYNKLIQEIEASNLSEEEKEFLRLAAGRFVRFDFDNIAEYYCTNASPEMQRLMEKLALIIVDFNDAIENEFVEMNKKLRKMLDGLMEGGEDAE